MLKADGEGALSVLAQCVMRTMVARDIPEILSWAKDVRLPVEARCSYILDLKRFAKKPGPAREALETFVSDAKVGRAAV